VGRAGDACPERTWTTAQACTLPNPPTVACAASCTQVCSPTGLLPEQVWDEPDRPEVGMYLGRPTGAAMPLPRVRANAPDFRYGDEARSPRATGCDEQHTV
jgi:hypothetical protein